jgi:ribosomal protein S18 acetylase RimI-like enzyme
MAAMHITVHDSAAGFLTDAGGFLNASEAENNIVSISAARIVSAPTRDDADTYLASIEDTGAVVAAALHSSAGGVLLTAGPVAALTLFAADMAQRGRAPKSMIGPLAACEAFAHEWNERTGQQHSLRFHLRHYELRRPPLVPQARGHMRVPRQDEHDLLLGWQLAFIDEVRLSDEPAKVQRIFARRLEQGMVRVWDDDGVVALAGYGDGGTDIARVAPVFTPPEHRRRNYASALVGELSRELFEQGKRAMFLTTDVANPTSNSIYRKIGYLPMADHYHFDFSPSPA